MAGNIVALSFIIISACCAVPLHNECSITSGWDKDGKEIIKEDIHYCLIDSCVIKRMDTSQELDIIDVGNDTLITMARDNHTSSVIALLPNEEYCEEVDDDPDHVHNIESTILLVMKAVLLVLVIMLSVYIIIVYLLWDNLQSSMSTLFITHNSLLAVDKVMLLVLVVFHAAIKTTAPLCQLIIYTDMYLKLSNKISTSIILMHIAYLLYQSRYQRFEVSAKCRKSLQKFYTFATFTAMIPMICFIILFDVFSDTGKDTVLSSGHCILPPVISYGTFIHLYGYGVPWKLIQLVAFILIVVHYKDLSNPPTGSAVDVPSVIGEPKVNLLFGLASVMVVSMSCSTFLCCIIVIIFSHYYTVSLYLDLMITLIGVMEQFIIAVRLTMLLKVKGLPKRFLV